MLTFLSYTHPAFALSNPQPKRRDKYTCPNTPERQERPVANSKSWLTAG